MWIPSPWLWIPSLWHGFQASSAGFHAHAVASTRLGADSKRLAMDSKPLAVHSKRLAVDSKGPQSSDRNAPYHNQQRFGDGFGGVRVHGAGDEICVCREASNNWRKTAFLVVIGGSSGL